MSKATVTTGQNIASTSLHVGNGQLNRWNISNQNELFKIIIDGGSCLLCDLSKIEVSSSFKCSFFNRKANFFKDLQNSVLLNLLPHSIEDPRNSRPDGTLGTHGPIFRPWMSR